jgi:hypothetical protein
MNRFEYLHKQYREAKVIERKVKALHKSRPVVDVNANGTQGYVVKNGPNTGKYLKHQAVIHPNSA